MLESTTTDTNQSRPELNQIDQRPMFVCPTARSDMLGSNEALLSRVKHNRTGRMRHQLSYPNQLPVSISPLSALALAARVRQISAHSFAAVNLQTEPKLQACLPLCAREGWHGLRAVPAGPPLPRRRTAVQGGRLATTPRRAHLEKSAVGTCPDGWPPPSRTAGQGRSPAATLCRALRSRAHPEKAAVGTCPDGCPAPRLMMRVSHSEKNRLTKCDSSVLVDACTRTVADAVSGVGFMR
jgi:hypothetical protein